MKNTALITWASSGIGKELAFIHAKTGGDLVLVARRKDALETIKTDLENLYNTQVYIIVRDLTEPTAVNDIYNEVIWQDIYIHYLINNAWFGGQGSFNDRDRGDDKNMILLNIMALTELTKLFLHDMVTQDKGKILNVSSTASFMPGPLQAVYFATKAYVQSFSNAVAYELEKSGSSVTLTNLMPWATETEFAQVSGADDTALFAKPFAVSGVAQDGYDAMISGQLDVLTGLSWVQKLMMYLLPLLPKKLVMSQVYTMQKIDE